MKTTVPCKITYSVEDICWYVESPGFYDGIMTDGATLEHAKEMASEAVSGLIAAYSKVWFNTPRLAAAVEKQS